MVGNTQCEAPSQHSLLGPLRWRASGSWCNGTLRFFKSYCNPQVINMASSREHYEHTEQHKESRTGGGAPLSCLPCQRELLLEPLTYWLSCWSQKQALQGCLRGRGDGAPPRRPRPPGHLRSASVPPPPPPPALAGMGGMTGGTTGTTGTGTTGTGAHMSSGEGLGHKAARKAGEVRGRCRHRGQRLPECHTALACVFHPTSSISGLS